MSGAWDRQAAIVRMRPRLWQYLSSTARVGELPGPARVVDLRREDLIRLFATHLGLRPTTDQALDIAGRLLTELPSSSVTVREELFGVVRGRVDWQRTTFRRTATADPTLFVCSPPERRYDTPLGRLIRLALWCMAQLHPLSGLPASGSAGTAVAELSERARRLLLHPKLTKVRRIEPRSLRHTEEIVVRRPVARHLVDFVHDFWAGAVEGSAERLRSLLEQQYLAPDRDASLFELQVGFDILDAFEHIGGVLVPPAPLLPAARVPFAELQGPFGNGRIWWQRTAWVLDAAQQRRGRWWRALDDNLLTQQPLIPDFVVDLPDLGRRFLVEVKLTALEDSTPERQGLREMLAYLSDGQVLFEGRPHPHGLVVAWNAAGRVTIPYGRLVVVDQDHVAEAMHHLLQA